MDFYQKHSLELPVDANPADYMLSVLQKHANNVNYINDTIFDEENRTIITEMNESDKGLNIVVSRKPILEEEQNHMPQIQLRNG